MEQENKPVETAQGDAGTPPNAPVEQGAADVNESVNAEKVIALIEEQDKALAAAETKIVSLKRQNKGREEVEEGGLEEQVNLLREEINSLKAEKSIEKDAELEQIQKLRKTNREFIEALKSKNSLSNSSLGSNQSVPLSKESPLKGLNEKELALIARRASALGMTPEDYLEKKSKK